jgi:hypothetical protein
VRSLWSRSFDFYRLRGRYRYLLAAFLVVGFVAGGWPVVDWAYGAQLGRGLTPGASLGSEPGSISFFLLTLVLLLGAGLLGMVLGACALCVVLTVFSPLSLLDSARAVFLSRYPASWFNK